MQNQTFVEYCEVCEEQRVYHSFWNRDDAIGRKKNQWCNREASEASAPMCHDDSTVHEALAAATTRRRGNWWGKRMAAELCKAIRQSPKAPEKPDKSVTETGPNADTTGKELQGEVASLMKSLRSMKAVQLRYLGKKVENCLTCPWAVGLRNKA